MLVHGGHLELELEVRNRPETPDDDIGTDLTGEVHGQSLEGLDDDFSRALQRRGLGLDDGDPFLKGEHRALAGIDGDAQDKAVHQLHDPTDDIGVAVVNWIEGAWIKAYALGHRGFPNLNPSSPFAGLRGSCK